MINEDLVTYIKAQLDAGMSREDITSALTNDGGWDAEDVSEAFDSFQEKTEMAQPPSKPTVLSEPVGADSDPKTYIEEKKYEPKDMMVGGDFFPKEEKEEAKEESQTKTSTEKAAENIESMVAPTPEKQGHSHVAQILVVVLAVAALLGASAYAYVSFFKPLPTPYEVLTSSLLSYADISSVTIQGTTTIAATTKTTIPSFGVPDLSGNSQNEVVSEEAQELSTDFSAAYNLTKTMNNPDQKLDGSVALRIGGEYGIMSIDMPIDVEYKLTDNMLYIRFTEIGQMPIPFDVSMFENVWIEFDLNQTIEAVESVYENAEKEQREKAQQIVEDVITSQNVIDFINDNLEVKNGSIANTYQVSVPLSAEMIQGFVVEVLASLAESETFREVVMEEAEAQGEDVSFEEVYAEVKAEFDEALTQEQWDAYDEVMRATEIDLWFEKGTFLPQSFRILTDIYDLTIEDSYLDLNIDSQTAFSNYNEPVVVDVPDNYVTIEEIARYVVGDPSFDIYDPLESSRVSNNDAMVKSYLNNARVHAELYYDTNSGNGYAGLCVSDAIKTVTQSIEDTVEGLVFCNADKTTYIIEAPLFSGESYYCIDSTGVATEKYTTSAGEDVYSCEEVVEVE